MKYFVVLCYDEGILKKTKNQFILGDRDVTFNQFDTHIRRVSGCRSSHIKIIYSSNCKARSVYVHVPTQKDSIVML